MTKTNEAATKTTGEKCWSCNGSGTYYGRGYVENGVFKGFTGPCFRCQGKGTQNAKDKRRNLYYDQHVRSVSI